MSFIGTTPAVMRPYLERVVRGVDHVWVCCSGYFTIERVLAVTAPKVQVHSNDVSLYSCLMGRYLAGEDMRVWIKDEAARWLEPFVQTPLDAIAAVGLFMYLEQSSHGVTQYHERMRKAIRGRWAIMHKESTDRLRIALDAVRPLASFTAGDCVDHAIACPNDAAIIGFPPTYKGGYERIYRRVDETFGWDAPAYQVFDEFRFATFLAEVRRKKRWLTYRDKPLVGLEDHEVGRFRMLPEEHEAMEACFKQGLEQLGGADVHVAHLREFDRLISALAAARGAHNVKNAAVALSIVLDLAARHWDDLQGAWLKDGIPVHDGMVPLASILGNDAVPAELGAKIVKAIHAAVQRGEIKAKEKWRILERLA